MFKNLFVKKTTGDTVEMTVSGMHCSSCALNIDFALEDLPGVSSSQTNFATAKLKVSFDPEVTSLDKIKKLIKKQGYIPKI